jgi:hypothetical protein
VPLDPAYKAGLAGHDPVTDRKNHFPVIDIDAGAVPLTHVKEE